MCLISNWVGFQKKDYYYGLCKIFNILYDYSFLGIWGIFLNRKIIIIMLMLIAFVATAFWPSVGVKPNIPKVGDLESSGTLECLEFNNKGQNTSHWRVLGVVGTVLKRRYRKWLRIGHLDICSSSYGQKKGWKSNWH